ncbi:MAG TPA: hypothetical protein VGA02_10830 [Gemmatimonadales bacterium]|jgi:hypothetical protein
MCRVLISLVAVACGALPLAAQQPPVPMPESYRGAQLRMLRLQRSLLLAMADSMPESLYRDKVTPVQRDFAQQIHHAANAVAGITARYMGLRMPELPDAAEALNSRAGLCGYVNATFDFAEGVLKSQTPESRAEVVSFFGQMEIPRWQIWDEVHQHTMWTAGQVVANFRKHDMPPPGYGFF